MGKRILNLYANDEDIQICKARGMNISELFRAFIKVELYSQDLEPSDKNELIEQLKIKLAKFSAELEVKRKEIEKLKKNQKNQVPERRGTLFTG